MDEEYERSWYATDDGQTIGGLGPQEGYILRDEEWGDPEDTEDVDARLTLEQGRADNPGFLVTAQLYGGWLFLACRRATQADGEALYESLRPELERLSTLIPLEGDRRVEQKIATLQAEIAALEAQFS